MICRKLERLTVIRHIGLHNFGVSIAQNIGAFRLSLHFAGLVDHHVTAEGRIHADFTASSQAKTLFRTTFGLHLRHLLLSVLVCRPSWLGKSLAGYVMDPSAEPEGDLYSKRL